MRLIQIAAVDQNGVIGLNGTMPWAGRYKEDLIHFKKVTNKSPIIMGRRTFDSLPKKPLPGRENIVMTSQKQASCDNLQFVNNIHQAVTKARRSGHDKVFIIGGSGVYKDFMQYCNELIITKIPENNDGDTFYPAIPKYYVEASREKISTDLYVDTYVNSLTCGLGFNLSFSSFYEVHKIWKNKLWPNYENEILPTSEKLYTGGSDPGIHEKAKAMFWCITNSKGEIVGATSAHATDNNRLIRSRGLYVDPKHKGRGLAKTLLAATIDWAEYMGYEGVWTMLQEETKHPYLSMGFDQTSDWVDDDSIEFSPYSYAYRDIKIF